MPFLRTACRFRLLWEHDPSGRARGHGFPKTGAHPGSSPGQAFSASCSSVVEPATSFFPEPDMSLPLSLAVCDYDRTRAIFDGRAAIEGCDVTAVALEPEESFHRAFKFQ